MNQNNAFLSTTKSSPSRSATYEDIGRDPGEHEVASGKGGAIQQIGRECLPGFGAPGRRVRRHFGRLLPGAALC
jgi:hypothetical protein